MLFLPFLLTPHSPTIHLIIVKQLIGPSRHGEKACSVFTTFYMRTLISFSEEKKSAIQNFTILKKFVLLRHTKFKVYGFILSPIFYILIYKFYILFRKWSYPGKY